MSLESLREELLGLREGLPFELIIGEVIQYPKLDPNWEVPDDFDWENSDAPMLGYIDAFTISWKWRYKDECYGSFFYVDVEKSAKEILDMVIANFEHSKDAIKGAEWTAQ